MKLSKKHILFLISGVILAGAYLLLSQTQCICHTQTANFGFVPREERPIPVTFPSPSRIR